MNERSSPYCDGNKGTMRMKWSLRREFWYESGLVEAGMWSPSWRRHGMARAELHWLNMCSSLH